MNCPECLDFITAIKGVWLLYMRGRWQQLAELGIDRKAASKLNNIAEDLLLGEGGKLKTNAQVYRVLQAYPGILDAAVRLNGVFRIAVASELPVVKGVFEL